MNRQPKKEDAREDTIRLAISTCPNDTFTFAGLINRQVDWQGLQFDIELMDIRDLNDRMFNSEFDVAKVSFYAALKMSKQTTVLNVGSALGFGVGPLLLAAEEKQLPTTEEQLTLCPGPTTTASMLFAMFYSNTTRVENTIFSDVMPRLQQRTADFGVCIHEGRFTWQQEGLSLVEDLGSRWERQTSSPLPLGGIVASNSLPRSVVERVESVVFESLCLARANPDSALPIMRQHAQEFDDDVLMKHVDLYVNDWTVDLGDVGRDALENLSSMARSAGLIDEEQSSIRIFV